MSESRGIESYVTELRHIAAMMRECTELSPYSISIYADRLETLARELKGSHGR